MRRIGCGYCVFGLRLTPQDAVMLHRISVTKYNDLTRERKQSHKYPNAQEEVKKLLIEIMRRMMLHKVPFALPLSPGILASV